VAQQLTELLQQQDGRRCLTTLLGTGVDPTDPCSIPACSTLSRRSTGSDFPLGWAAAGLAPTCGCQAGRQGGGWHSSSRAGAEVRNGGVTLE